MHSDFCFLLFKCRKDIKKAINILNSELKVFAREDDDLYKEMAMLLTLENIR